MEKKKLREPGTCRIFFSSPFGGMEEEREELTRKYFPKIQHECKARGVQFVAVDMRWGITSQSADTAQVINICLREIDRSDIFVGFFGQRYGWHGADDKQLQENFDNAVGRYSWLDGVRDRSVTELEFLHGHLNNPGSLPTCICFRDKAYDDEQREGGEAKGDKKQVFKYSSESNHATSMMDNLKDRVKATESKCLAVDLSYSHPHEGAKFMFDSIWPYLSEVLLASADDGQATKRQKQLVEHDAFRARHVSVYHGGQQYLSALDGHLEAGLGGVLVTGPAGSGKSALLCNWTARLLKSPQALVIYHFVGCAPGTTDAPEILSRLLREAKQLAGRGEEKEEETQDVRRLLTLLLGSLEEAHRATCKQIVIILDGLNSTRKTGKTSKHLYWLPDTWPKGVVFVTSTVDTDSLTSDLLVSERSYDTLAIQPLQDAAKQEICVAVLKQSGKELSDEQLARVVTADQTNNPLFLRLVLAELSIFGYFRLLDKKIDSLIYCSDVGELLQKIFSRLEEDYNGKEEYSQLVQEVLCAIALSRQGLLEKEVRQMLSVESQDWSPLYFALEGLLVSHAGLLRFAFAEISQAVQDKYLQDEKLKAGMLKKMTGFFDEQLQSIAPWDDLMTELSKRPVQELPWLHKAAGDMDSLCTTLLNVFTLHRMQAEVKYELLELWKSTGKKMSDICDLYLASFDLAVADLYLHNRDTPSTSVTPPGLKLRPVLTSLMDFLDLAEFKEESLRVSQRGVNILEHVKGAMPETEHLKDSTLARYQLATYHVDCRHDAQGERLLREVMEDCQSYLKEHPGDYDCRQTVGMITNGIGVLYIKQKRFEEAVAMFRESLKMQTEMKNTDRVVDCNSNLGMALMETGQLQEGLEIMENALKMTEERYFGHLPLEIGNLLTNIGICYRRLNNFDKAEEMYNRSVQVKANAVGWDHDVVAMAYMNLSALNTRREDFAKAEIYIRKTLAIQKGNGFTLDRQEHRQANENLLCDLMSQNKMEEALPVFKPLFRKIVEHGDMDQCIPSVHRSMAKYLLSMGDASMAREVTLAQIGSVKARHHLNYLFLDHLQRLLPEEERPELPPDCSLEHALTLWPGNPDLYRGIIEHHALPAGDLDMVMRLQKECAESNREWGAVVWTSCADWCETGGSQEGSARVLEAGLLDYPDELAMRVRLMDLYRSMKQHARAYPHLPRILEGRGDDPACVVVAGDIAMRSDDYTLALDCFDKVVTMDNPQLALMAETAAKNIREALSNAENETATGQPEKDTETGQPE